MDKLDPPEQLSFEGNVRENWRRWKQEFELYLVATESDGKSKKVKSSILLTCIGKRAREIYNTFTFANDEDKKSSPRTAILERTQLSYAISSFPTTNRTDSLSMILSPN